MYSSVPLCRPQVLRPDQLCGVLHRRPAGQEGQAARRGRLQAQGERGGEAKLVIELQANEMWMEHTVVQYSGSKVEIIIEHTYFSHI